MGDQCQHPLLHPSLQHFNPFTSFVQLINSEEVSISFLQEIGLLPTQTSIPPRCPCGEYPMKVVTSRQSKLGWIWQCDNKLPKKKGVNRCNKVLLPTHGTFFDGQLSRIPINEVLAIIICFVIKWKVNDVFTYICNWRRSRGQPELSKPTIIDYYSYCREIAEVISSHTDTKLGGVGKTVMINETFLTKRKYHRGRIREQMTIIVLGLYCKEDKVGLFFRVNSKTKRELWPYIYRYVDQTTSYLCTDSAKQYHGIERMFEPGTSHMKTNHSIGQYVDKSNINNTINPLENQNRQFKSALLSRRTPKLIHQYMALFFYRKQYLEKQYKDDLGSQIMQFLLDVKIVYPGVVDGKLKEGLELKYIDPPTVESENLQEILPPKRSRVSTIEESIDESEDINDSSEYHPFSDDDFY